MLADNEGLEGAKCRVHTAIARPWGVVERLRTTRKSRNSAYFSKEETPEAWFAVCVQACSSKGCIRSPSLRARLLSDPCW